MPKLHVIINETNVILMDLSLQNRLKSLPLHLIFSNKTNADYENKIMFTF